RGSSFCGRGASSSPRPSPEYRRDAHGRGRSPDSRRRHEGESDRGHRSRSGPSTPSKRQVDEVFVHSGVAVSGAGSVSSVVLPLETGLVDTPSTPAVSLVFRFAQMQIDDHARTLQNLLDAHTEQP
ncbi:unnamed protein product, partial [Pylaiella littoralis]